LNFDEVNKQSIVANWLTKKGITLDVLRLDKIHPVVSGNKYFKLKYYLEKAASENKREIATFGGAWSNHIVATAFACKEAGLISTGFIRGEKPATLSITLQTASDYGMQLYFVTRDEYRSKDNIKTKYEQKNILWIGEGGYGVTGAKGAAEILKLTNTDSYTHIIAAVGTGTMLAGLISSAESHQQVIGISSMKGNTALMEEIKALMSPGETRNPYRLFHDYHFGGYGKHPKELIDYINSVYENYSLPLDIVYTAKTFFAIEDLVRKDFFTAGSKLLMIHSGGLQGNKSLAPKVLAF